MCKYPWADFSLNAEKMEKALEVSLEDQYGFAEHIAGQIQSDSDCESERILRIYKDATAEEKRLINAFCVALCGWSFPSLIEQFLDSEICPEFVSGRCTICLEDNDCTGTTDEQAECCYR